MRPDLPDSISIDDDVLIGLCGLVASVPEARGVDDRASHRNAQLILEIQRDLIHTPIVDGNLL